MAGDSIQEWYERAEALCARHAKQETIASSQLRLAMGELWRLLIDVPDPIHVAYRNLTEDELAGAELIYHDALDEGRLAWGITRDLHSDALSIGAQLRALDSELAGRPFHKAAPSSPSSLYCKEIDAFIVPRGHPKPTDRHPGPGNGLGRRATPHHRILPRVLPNGLKVELVWSPHLAFGLNQGQGQALGAALIPGMKVQFDEQANGTHRAVSAPCENEEAIFEEQLAGAYGEPMLAVAWPELCMPADRRARLQTGMKARSLLAKPLDGPTITVAGSWHDDEGEVVRNIMRVLDKSGNERLAFVKITTFVGGGLTEANVPGDTIPVLINNDALVTFAVCSDFCDMAIPPPYLALDVDLLVVPSLGTEAALNGHEANSRRFQILFGASTFLVQQNEWSDIPVGWVLPHCPVGKVSAENKPWSRRQVAFT